MTSNAPRDLRRRALRLVQDRKHPLYLFALKPDELFQIADISRVSRDGGGDLIGYQRPEVRKHVQNIVDYLNSNSGQVLFPNTLILALSSAVRFVQVRGPKVEGDGVGEAGTLILRLPRSGERKPAWIVDGQQRALAISRARRSDLPIPVSAFIADDLETQREQFLRVNSSKPLPRGLISELLPQVSTVLPPNLSARRAPAALCESLNRDPSSPFYGLIRRSSADRRQRKGTVVSDTALIQVLQESFSSPNGCLFAYRNLATGETDFERIQRLLQVYWSAVKDTFPNAWGLPPTQSRLMHSVGLKAMARLMDRVMSTADVDDRSLPNRVRKELAPLRTKCNWTAGTWEELGGLRWNELQNVPNHVRILTNHIQRLHLNGAGTGR
ncbi:DGQHR domain-containing protein DpdB [Hyalangium rubrum]|uniref:DGQHR domain-containing protein DpdB n=1 Tax=Hyalangium rubrum TaxID=3103134 RepID=A0ABU5HEI5_9BACT|nr:DGQHR domain-containing protein DpdB [Hyalangium sp. s54d21]MDY7231534.1 DGQHR domain-containing protein DpdB [Hyalangium sp. s54d21]